MAKKTIKLILLGADRKLWEGEPPRLQVTDLNNSKLTVLHSEKLKPNSNIIQIDLDLLFDAGQVYGISVDVKKHRAAWQLITRRSFLRQQGGIEVEVKEIIMQLMLVPNKPSSSDLDDGHRRLHERGSPMVAPDTGLEEKLYLNLSSAAKMAFLNIEAKLRETRLNEVSLLSFVRGVSLVAVDRLFLLVKSGLKQIIEDSAEFASAPGHGAPTGTPVPLPAHPDSWKHRRFGAGNIQLSFSEKAETAAGILVFSVDADIDLERGLAHVGEWLDNKLNQKKTDQTLVYALLFSQGVIPDYTLDTLPADD